MSAFLELTESQLDALREIGTIGAGNGATALSVMMGKRIHMTVPEIKIIPFTEVTEALGGAEQVVAGLFTTTTGQAPCNILFVLPIESARVLVDILMGRPLGTTAELDALDKSALAEVANVVSGAYLNSLSSFTKLDFYSFSACYSYRYGRRHFRYGPGPGWHNRRPRPVAGNRI